MNTDLDENGEGIQRGGQATFDKDFQRQKGNASKTQDDQSQVISVDLSVIEAEKEREEISKMSRMGSQRKNIVKGPPQSKRIIFFNSINEETLRKNQPNTNRVRMTKYTLLSLVPLSLFNQFKRISNIYFLVISVLTFLPFSPKDPASMIGTFAMVLFFTLLKDAFEDYKRYKQQTEVNQKKSRVLKSHIKPVQNPESLFKEATWDQITTGQVVMIKKNEEIPADLLMLCSSNESGIAFVDTMALDGETNLKEKVTAMDDYHPEMGLNHALLNLSGNLLCDQPNDNLEHWEGILNLPKQSSQISCSIKNLLIRGSFLKNTTWIVGVVVYTGHDTKIFRNSKSPPHKISNVMKQMNSMLLQVFILQLIIVFLSTGMNYYWAYNNILSHLEIGSNSQQTWDNLLKNLFQQFLAYWVTFSHMIPISLYVAIEALKLTQAMLIGQDAQMYDSAETKAFGNCKNSDLTEELGQVQMIFSDKTGTLTMNKMEFKKCTIGGIRYCEPQSEKEMKCIGICQSGIEQIQSEIQQESEIYYNSSKANLSEFKVLDFFKALALCHTVVCENSEENTDDNLIPTYQASSPDELALVQGASSVGIVFKQRSHSIITIQNYNSQTEIEENFRVLCEFPFDSTRKCMSLLLQDEQTSKIYLYSKGADNVMLGKIDFQDDPNLKSSIVQDLYSYSCQGFRTLVLGFKEMSQAEFEKFDRIHSGIQLSTSQFKEKQLSELYSKYEQDLLYLGSTAIEDKLQDGVPETISKILAAEIRFWVLTGDKLETAIEIAKSCQIIQNDTLTVILAPQPGEPLTPQVVRQVLIQKAKEIKNYIDENTEGCPRKSRTQKRVKQKTFKKVKGVQNLSDFKHENIVLVIEGSVLAVIFGTKDLEERFFQLGLEAKSVICCRVSPKQKADVVQLYKKRGDWVTLSVGDGANDVSMILEANIGVGIRGKEGTQAIRSADYSISQFRFLQKLLLIHGRLGYIRVSKMIFAYFYKNIVLVFTEIPFHFYTGFSGQLFFLDWLPTLYNAVFTSWQCLFAFMYERDINQEYTMKFPLVYKIGQEGRLFKRSQFWSQIVLAFYQGLLCFYIPLIGFGGASPASSDGRTFEHWYYSTISFSLILHLVTYKLFVDSSYWTIFSFLSGILGIALFYLIGFIGAINSVSKIFQPQLDHMMNMIASDIRFYYLQMLVPILCIIPNLAYNFGKQIFYPEIEHTIMHMQDVLGEQRSPQKTTMRKHSQKDSLKKLQQNEGKEKLRSAMKRGGSQSPKATMSPKGSEDEEYGRVHGSILPFIPSPQDSTTNGLYYSRRWGFVSNARISPEDETDVGSSPKKYPPNDSASLSPFKQRSKPQDNYQKQEEDLQQISICQNTSMAQLPMFSTPKKRQNENTIDEEEELAQFSAKKQREISKRRKLGQAKTLTQSASDLMNQDNSLKGNNSSMKRTNPNIQQGRNFGRMVKTQVHPEIQNNEEQIQGVESLQVQSFDPSLITKTFSSPQKPENQKLPIPYLLHLQSLQASPSTTSNQGLINCQNNGAYVPSLVAMTGRANPSKLLEEGHPLELSYRSPHKQYDESPSPTKSPRKTKRKPKKYVEKYRDLAAIERALINDDIGLFTTNPPASLIKKE